ncbi:MAG: hypothetical protein P4L92_11960 [Rudaea sp.]|nr:hypothetical protein [Rudaea sp.]
MSWSNALCAITIAALAAVVLWPGLHGFWGRDDFGQLAFVRLLDSPWPLFLHDHYFAPGSVFRPLGFASMWLCERWFGRDYAANAAVDLALHISVSLALFGLMRRTRIPRMVALPCAALFALHPAAVGTALWWSARFDLLAALFVLLSLNAAFAYRSGGPALTLVTALAAALAAALSKEIGLVAIAAQSLVWLRWAWAEPAHRARALRAVSLSWLCALIFLGWRWVVLGTLSSSLTVMVPLGDAMRRGLQAWVIQAPGYLTFWPRLDVLQRVTLGSCCAAAVVATGIVAIRQRGRIAELTNGDMVLSGVCLLLLPVVLQAPVAAFAAPIGAQISAVETAMQSRLYYLGIAGAAIVLAALASACWNASATRLRIACVLPPMLSVLALASISRDGAQAFAQRSLEISSVARAAATAVATMPLPSSPCHVMFLDVQPPPEWGTYVAMDAVIKALSPDLDRVKHCWFHANYGTLLNLMAAPVSPADAAPYLPLEVDGRPLPWRTLGGVVLAYLRPPESVGTPANRRGCCSCAIATVALTMSARMLPAAILLCDWNETGPEPEM